MRLFASLTMNVDPVAVCWTENKQPKCLIFRDAQSAMDYFHENNLWGSAGYLFAEDGAPLDPPKQPKEA